MNKKNIFVFILSCIYNILFFVFLASANEKVTLQLKWKHQFQFAGYYAAIDQGYYNEEGLDVTLVEGKAGGKEVEEVLSGRANYGVGMSDILISRLQGKPVVLVANIFQHSPVTLLTMQKSNFTSPQDLYRKKIRMTKGPKSAELQAMFINEGVKLEDLNLTPPNWKIEDLITGKIDAIAAYISSQPYILFKRSIPYTLISPSTYGIDFYGDNLFTSEREVAENPERVAAFRRASLKGWNYALNNKDEIIDLIVSKYLGNNTNLDRDFLEQEAAIYDKLILPQFVKLGHTNPGRWQHIAETYAKLGMTDKDYSLDGFFFQPELSKFSWNHWSLKLLAIIIVTISLVTLLLSIFNRRLKQEIKSHQQTGKKLQESEEKFRALFEQAGGYCMVLDPNTTDGIPIILEANKAACLMHGYEHDEFIGQPVAIIDDEDGKKLVKQRTAEILTGKPFYVENQHIRQDGTKFFVAVNAIRIDLGDKPPLILTTEYDITERKRAERELIEREEQYRAIVENSGDCIMRYDRDYRHIYANENAVKISGLPRDQYIEKTHQEMGWPAHLCAVLKENINQVFVTGNSGNVQFNLEVEGKIMTHDLQLNPEFNDTGDVQTVIGISRDITSQKQLEAKLRQAQKMETIGTLAGGIAHDFNNILSSVIGFTELALDSVDNQSVEKDDLLEIYSAGLRARDLVNQILAFARQSEEKIEPLQIGPIILDVVKFLRSTIPATTEIKHQIESVSLVKGNETQIHQVMMNLCNNAAQAIGGVGVLSISVKEITVDADYSTHALKTAIQPGAYVMISVSDNGPGIEPNILEKIFEPYFTTKATGEGTGLGLAVVHGIVESYDGKILIDSSLGKGTTFTIYLPVCSNKKIDPPLISETLPTGNERILLVDDEVSITKMNSRVLSQLGYAVTAKNNSVEALALFRSKPDYFDLVISDVAMPDMTGEMLAKELILIKKQIPIILCTGFSQSLSPFSAAEIGVKAFVNKPIVKADLAMIVRTVLDQV